MLFLRNSAAYKHTEPHPYFPAFQIRQFRTGIGCYVPLALTF